MIAGIAMLVFGVCWLAVQIFAVLVQVAVWLVRQPFRLIAERRRERDRAAAYVLEHYPPAARARPHPRVPPTRPRRAS